MEKRTTSPYPRVDRRVLAGDRRGAGDRHGALHVERPRARLALLPDGVRPHGRREVRRRPRGAPARAASSRSGSPTCRAPIAASPAIRRPSTRASRTPSSRIAPTRSSRCKQHPIEDYGCTSCHGGQGWAIDTAAAHGEVAHWEEPLLSRSLGEAYTLAGNKNALMQMNCNTCHRYDRETPGAGAINLAKRLVNEKGCRACHVINGFGGTIGPDLTDGRREAARAVRAQPPVGPAHGVCLARRALQGSARAQRGHRDAELQLQHRAGAGARRC